VSPEEKLQKISKFIQQWVNGEIYDVQFRILVMGVMDA
jgi:hypothetical protein